jgi:hypothetical protein
MYRRDSHGHVGDPYIPARFAAVIGAIGGLNNMMRAVPLSHSTLRQGG